MKKAKTCLRETLQEFIADYTLTAENSNQRKLIPLVRDLQDPTTELNVHKKYKRNVKKILFKVVV